MKLYLNDPLKFCLPNDFYLESEDWGDYVSCFEEVTKSSLKKFKKNKVKFISINTPNLLPRKLYLGKNTFLGNQLIMETQG